MMRSRHHGRPCRVEGHGSRCEVSQSRRPRTRTQEKRSWRNDMASEDFGAATDTLAELFFECGFDAPKAEKMAAALVALGETGIED